MQKEIMDQIKRMANDLEMPSALIPSAEDIQTWKLTYGDKVESYNNEKEQALLELEKYCKTEKDKECNSSVIEFDKKAELLKAEIADLRTDSLRKTELLKSLGLFAASQKKQLKSEIMAIEKKISDVTSTYAREYDYNAKDALIESINTKWEIYHRSNIDEIEKKYTIPVNPEDQYKKIVSVLSKMKELRLYSEDKKNLTTRRYNALVKLRILSILSNYSIPLTPQEILNVYNPIFDDSREITYDYIPIFDDSPNFNGSTLNGSKLVAMLTQLKNDGVVQRIEKDRKLYFTLT